MSVTRMSTLPNNQTHYLKNHEQPLVNPETLRTFQLICYGIIGEAVAIFGIGTNIMNIICFVKQGFKESINVSLLCLAISDLGSLITMLWMNACVIPEFQEADLTFDPLETNYLISCMPHVIFTRVTGVITAFITLERCLCITMPLKVASIFRPKRVAIINACILVFLITSVLPVYASGAIGMKYFPQKNKTIVGVVFTKDRAIKEQISFIIHSVLVPFSALIIIIVCMVVIVIALRKQLKWRQHQRGACESNSSTKREQRLVKMIVMISVLFVICFCPSAVLCLGIAIEPKFGFGNKYFEFSVIVYGLSAVAESTNASMNIFIYYTMSTKYRDIFRHMFCGVKLEMNQTFSETVSKTMKTNYSV